jgi:hypothetical protein
MIKVVVNADTRVGKAVLLRSAFIGAVVGIVAATAWLALT